jgi:hypothetical protein
LLTKSTKVKINWELGFEIWDVQIGNWKLSGIRTAEFLIPYSLFQHPNSPFSIDLSAP